MYTIGQKIDFKRPGTGRGRPSSGTIDNIGDTLTVTTRLGDKAEVDPSWVLGAHKGTYNRKVAEAA